MDNETLIRFMSLGERLKCNMRHSWTSSGRKESVAEHTYRLLLFAWLVKEEFEEVDMDRLYQLCLFHDLGEAVTGDIPCFEKKQTDERKETKALEQIAEMLPGEYQKELNSIFKEVTESITKESKLLHALDKMEAVIQHNEAPIETWLPLEYELQLIYGVEAAEAFPYLRQLREAIRNQTNEKIRKEQVLQNKTMDRFTVSTDREKIEIPKLVNLMYQTSWAKGRKEEEIIKAMQQSKVYGVYEVEQGMVGYARVVTDETTIFYLCDVVIDEKYRGFGAGSLLVDKIIEDYKTIYGILHTEDAEMFYESYGFKRYERTHEMIMTRDI